MAQWNLSVDIRGQGTNLASRLRADAAAARALATAARSAKAEITGLGTASQAAASRLQRTATHAGRTSQELRRLAREAERAEQRLSRIRSDVRVRVRLDDQTAAGATAIRARLNALAGGNINLTANLNSGNTAAAAAALRAADNAARDLERTLRTLRLRALAAAASLDEVRNSALTATVGIRSLNSAVADADGRLTTMSTHVRTLRTDMDDLNGSLTRVTGNLGGLRGSLGGAGNSASQMTGRTRLLIQGAIALGAALIPVAAAVAPLAAGMAAAGAAAGAFGLAIAGQVAHLTNAAEAEKKYQDAVAENGAGSKEAAEAQLQYLRQMQKLPPATREAAAAFSVLKDDYTAWSDSLAGDTMPVATKSFAVFSELMHQSTPFAKAFASELNRTVTIVAGGLRSEGWQEFMDNFAEFSTETLAKANHYLVRFMTGMDTGEIGGNLREFMAYARENGPLVADTLGELGRAVMHLLVAFSDVGVGILQVLNPLASAFADLVSAVPPGALAVFLQLAATMKLVTLAATALGVATGGAAAGRLAAYFAVMRAAGVGPTLRATAASMSAVTKAGLGLGVLTLAVMGIDKLAERARRTPPDIDKLTTSLKELALSGKATGEFASHFGDMDGLARDIGKLQEAMKDQEEYVESFGNSGIGVLDDLRRGANNWWQDFTKGEDSLKSLEGRFKSVDETLAGLVASGHADVAAENFNLIAAAAKREGKSLADVNALLPEYNAAVKATAAEQKLAVAAMGIFGSKAVETQAKLNAQKGAVDGLRQSIIALNDTNRAAYDGQIAFEQAVDDLTASFKENGSTLDLNSEAGRKNGSAMSQVAKAHDEMVTSGIAAGESLGSMTAKSDALRTTMMKLATEAFGGSKAKATEYVNTLLGVPGEIKTLVELERTNAVKGLEEVQNEIQKTPGAKSVTVSTLNAAAIRALEEVGLKTKTLPDGKTAVYTANGQAIGPIDAVFRRLLGIDGKTAHTYVYTHYKITGKPGGPPSGTYYGSTAGRSADGNIYGPARPAPRVRAYAEGGMENHVAQIAQPTFRIWAEPETGGEAYIPFAPSKRPRSRAIAEETVRRLGGDPRTIQWNANGNVTDWRYDPSTGSLYSPSDAYRAGQKTRKVKGKEISYFDMGAFEKRLRTTSDMTRRWNRDLEKVADRVGGDVAEALAAMGTEGYELTKKMATGSTAYINKMAAALRGLAAEARASLTDYTRQLSKATAADSKFAANLATLAGRGYGDLAKQLAAQGDQAAMELAAAAVSDSKKAASANQAAKTANNALTNEQVAQLVAIIAAVKTSKTGIHDVAATTGLGEDEIIATASKATAQIRSALGDRSVKFLADLARAQKGLSYANGGIRAGMYATRGGIVRFAEPETGGEAYIPLGANKRRQASRVLRDVAGRFGVGLTDLQASKHIVVVREGGDTHVTVTPVRTGASATDIGYQVGRSVRRARRGGVAARA